MIVGFNLFEMYFLKLCHELFFMNSIVAGGFWQGQSHPNRGYSKFKFWYRRAEY